MSNKRFYTLVAFALAVTIAGCGGTKKTGITPPASDKVIEAAPDWFLKIPQDNDFIFASATATSRDMQMARDKAGQSARLDIAKAVELLMKGVSKRFQEEVGQTESAQYLDQFTQASNSVVSTVLTGVTMDKSVMKEESGVFRSYVLMKMPIGAASQALLERIQKQDQLYTRFRSTQVFDDLNKEAEAFEKWKTGEK